MEKIVEGSFSSELRESYLKYALSVIVGRAIPDARDGLKPVQRRILYSMYELGLMPDKPFRKSATVVGDVIGKYHPHGDQAVYDALVRMAQDFSMRYPLIQGQGNFGSIDGDPPAAYRYTEARLSKIAVELLNDIKEDTVDFVPNFDGRLREPVLLPAAFPNLLANGASGIAVGMATNIPPHNLGELIDALVALIDNPHMHDEELLSYVKGPDFPTGGVVIGINGLKQAYLTGKGKVVVRGRYHIEDRNIVITEIPYAVNKSNLIQKIAELVKGGKIEGVSDLRDESDKEGLRVVIEVKKGYNPNVIINQLLKYTPLQETYGINMLAIVDNEPRVLTLRKALEIYLDFKKEIVIRRTRFRLRKAEERLHLVIGFLKALDVIDEIIAVIRGSQDVQSARENLIERFGFSEKQAQAILELRLQNLTRLERHKLEEERKQLEEKIAYYNRILNEEEFLNSVMKEELLEIKEKYADPRRTEILYDEDMDTNIDIESLIQKEDIVILITRGGYIKRMSLRGFRSQNRNTKGKKGITTYEDDVPFRVTISSTHSTLLFITKKGRVYWMKAYNLPEMGFSARGRHIRNFFPIDEDDMVVSIVDITEYQYKYLVVVTKHGRVKRVRLDEVLRGRMGTALVNLKGGDEVVVILPTVGTEDILIATESGKGVRLRQDDIPVRSRRAGTVIGIKSEGVVDATPVIKNSSILMITEKGYGKKVRESDIRPLGRGTKGFYIIKLREKTGKLVRVMNSVSENEQMAILTEKGITARIDVSGVKEYSRQATGVKILDVSKDDRVVDAVLISG